MAGIAVLETGPFSACTFGRSRLQWGIERERALYPDPSSMQPITIIGLVTAHKVLGVVLGLVVLVFVVSVVKIVTGLVRIRKIRRMQRELDRHG